MIGWRAAVLRAALIALTAAAAFAQDQAVPPAAAERTKSQTKATLREIRDMAKEGSGAIPRLVPFLSDTNPDVRRETVKAIAQISTQYSLDPLIKATSDGDPEVQIRATDGLVNFYLPGYIRTGLGSTFRRAGTALKGHFTDTNDQVIESFVMVRPEVIAALGKLTSGNSEMEVRANAARALGILRGRAAEPDLIAALHTKDTDLIYEALVALEKIRDPAAGPEVSFLTHDLNERVQVTALEATGLLLNRAAIPQVRDVLEHSDNDKVRRTALNSLALMPAEETRPVFQSHLNDKDDDMRQAAAEGLGRLKNPADIPALENGFNNETKIPARLGFAFALVSEGRQESTQNSALRYLIDELNSSAYRGVARAYLTELSHDTGVRQAMYAPLRERDATTRDEKIELLQILSVSGDRATVPEIEALTHDPDTQVAQAAVRATRNLRARLNY